MQDDFFQLPSKPQKKKKPAKRLQMKEGDMVKSKKTHWKVIKLLGSGGFGDVYKVRNTEKEEHAMKTEMIEGEKRMLRLKIELLVLQMCHSEKDPDRRRHLVSFVDKGITDTFKFLVMGLVGPSLEDIRSKYLNCRDFSRPTAMRAAEQTLKAISDLHFIGWLHRDIKPQNFAVGVGGKEQTVFMLDFGIARRLFVAGTREVKKPRAKVKFLGTIRFCSRACHYQQEQGRKDDLEAWLYMTVDLFDQRALPWKGFADKTHVALTKDKFFLHRYPKSYSRIQKMHEVADYISGLQWMAEPDYAHIHKLLEMVKRENRIDTSKELDWAGKLDGRDDDSSSSETSSDNRQSGSDSTSQQDASEAKRRSGKKSTRKDVCQRKRGGYRMKISRSK